MERGKNVHEMIHETNQIARQKDEQYLEEHQNYIKTGRYHRQRDGSNQSSGEEGSPLPKLRGVDNASQSSSLI